VPNAILECLRMCVEYLGSLFENEIFSAFFRGNENGLELLGCVLYCNGLK